MDEGALLEAGQLAAVKALGELALSSFGAIDQLELAELAAMPDGENGYYWMLRWDVLSMGLAQESVNMVVLPEFLTEDNAEPAWLAEQMSAFIVERVLASQAGESSDTDDEDE